MAGDDVDGMHAADPEAMRSWRGRAPSQVPRRTTTTWRTTSGRLLEGHDVPEGLPLDPDLRWSLLTALAAAGQRN